MTSSTRSLRARTATEERVPPSCGGAPVRISHRNAPSPKTSVRASTSSGRAARLLRRHVGGGPDDASGLETSRVEPERDGVRAVRDVRPGRTLPEHLREAPVHDLHLAEGAHHDVAGLQVAVDDAAGVGVGHGLGDLLEDPEEAPEVGRRVGPTREQRGERLAPDELHREEGRPCASHLPRS